MLGENMMQQRKRRGLSQQALADEIHVVRQTISKWEKNLPVTDAEALTRLADALDTTVQELLGVPAEKSDEPADVAAVSGGLWHGYWHCWWLSMYCCWR